MHETRDRGNAALGLNDPQDKRKIVARMLAPTLAVVIGWLWLKSAWGAILLYHLQILFWSRGQIPKAWRGWNRSTFLRFALPAAGFFVLIYLLLPHITRQPVGTWFAEYGLEGWALALMIPYFGVLHPVLEQAHWGTLRESRYGTFSHLAFAAYHGIVVASLLPPSWVAVCVLTLLGVSWLWTYMARSARGGWLVPTLSHIFADLGMVSAAAVLALQPAVASAQDSNPQAPGAPPKYSLELLRDAIAKGDNKIRCQAVRALGQLDEEPLEVLYLFEVALQDTSASHQQCALWGLKDRGARHEDVLPLLRKASIGEDVVLAKRCMIVLSELGKTWPVCEDFEQARLDARPEIRIAALTRMLPGICETEYVLPLLAQSLLDEESKVRNTAAAAIASYGADAIFVVDELMAAVDDPDPSAQLTIIRALGNTGPAAAKTLGYLRSIEAYGYAKQLIDTSIAKISGEMPIRPKG